MVLTEKAISKINQAVKRQQFFDDEVSGFGLRIAPNGTKTFIWLAKVRGKLRFRSLGEFGDVSVKEARDHAAELNGQASEWRRKRYEGPDPFERAPLPPVSSTPTFEQVLEAYIAHVIARSKDEGRSPEKIAKSEYRMRWLGKKFFNPWYSRKLDAIKIDDVLKVKNDLGARHHLANRCVEFIRAIYNWSSKSNDGRVNFWRCDNPAKDVSYHEEKEREEFLKPEQLLRFQAALVDEPDRDLADYLVLALNTGARKSDVLSARWADIDFDTACWKVPFPKNGESYVCNLLPAAMEVLKRRSEAALDDAIYVFPGPGKYGHRTDLKKKFAAFRKRAGIPQIRQHDIRRTTGSYLAMAGVSMPIIAQSLGHKSLSSTAIYARVANEAVKAAGRDGQAKMIEMMDAASKRLGARPEPVLAISPKQNPTNTARPKDQRAKKRLAVSRA